MRQLCSADSDAREEPLVATASRVERWLLVEHRGAWGPQSVPSSRLPHSVARALAQAADDAGARLLMIRRPAGVRSGDGRQVFAVDSRPGSESVRTRHIRVDSELPSLGWASGPDWEPYDGALYLVCTHGRHDRCCALRGRPVAKALSREHPERTWEVSHVGGDRFAANLVVLPEGLYLGRLSADDVVRVVEALRAGLLPAGHVRGRSSLPTPTQAALSFARDALEEWRSDRLEVVQQVAEGVDMWRVRLADPGVEVVVRYDRAGDGERHLLTCTADQPKVVPVFRQVSLTTL